MQLLQFSVIKACVCVGGCLRKIKTNNKFEVDMALFRRSTGRGHLVGLKLA